MAPPPVSSFTSPAQPTRLQTIYEDDVLAEMDDLKLGSPYSSPKSTVFSVWTNAEHAILRHNCDKEIVEKSLKDLLLADKRLRVVQTARRVSEYGDTELEWQIIVEEVVGHYRLGACLQKSLMAHICEGYSVLSSSSAAQQRVIVKRINKGALKTEHRVAGGIRERVVHEKLQRHPHPNIVGMLDWIDDEQHAYLVMPALNNCVDLFDLIEHSDFLSEDVILTLFRQIVAAVVHLHALNIVHRDLKDENVIVDQKTLHCQLIDFGSAAILSGAEDAAHGSDGGGKGFEKFYGTIDYAAPEIVLGRPYTGKPQDVWALGVLLYTMTYKEVPFRSMTEIQVGHIRVPFEKASLRLIRRMLVAHPEDRPTIEQVAADPWLLSEPNAAASIHK